MRRLALGFLGSILALLAGAALSAGTVPPPAPADAAAAFDRLAADYLVSYLAAHPVRATELGIHTHDARLRDMSHAAVKRRLLELEDWLFRLSAIDRARLAQDAYYDHKILEHAIRAEILELAEVRDWQRNPMLYNRLMADGVASLIDRGFSPLPIRLGDLIDRLALFPTTIRAAKKNLHDVPAAWTELAVRNTEGHVRFLRDGVPLALEEQGLADLDPALAARWDRAHRRAVRRLERFARWLDRDLRPRSRGDFRLGRDLFERKLLYEEHMAFGVDELVALNEKAIERYAAWVSSEATRIDPTRPADEVLQQVTEGYPPAEELIDTARRFVEQARDLVVERRLVTLPTEGLPIVRPTPEYARTGFASMSAPGPFETEATEAYYNITNVDPAWDEEQQHQHLTYFNYSGLLGISVHEAMPGHFVQLLYQRELPTDLRRVFVPASLVEGWAHYAEQLMVDEGLGDGDPQVRLGQLRRALQRHARWYAGLALHTTDASIEEVAARFAEIAHFAPFPAYRETLRGTYNPTYLYYALGRMEILELREDYRKECALRGEPFSLQEFHDRFLRLGLPLPLAREAMLGGDASQVSD